MWMTSDLVRVIVEMHWFGFDQSFNLRNRIKCGIGDLGINLHHGQSLQRSRSLVFTTQREVGNVHTLLTQRGTDLANHTRHILIAANQQMAFERNLDIDAVKGQQTRLHAVNHRSGCAADA